MEYKWEYTYICYLFRFAIADTAYRSLKEDYLDQCILISGNILDVKYAAYPVLLIVLNQKAWRDFNNCFSRKMQIRSYYSQYR